MNSIFGTVDKRVVAEALMSQRLCVGRLMSPEEVASATEGHGLPPTIGQSWSLCGNLPPLMFASESLKDMRHLGQMFRGPGGVTYLVLAQQCGRWQHRFVVQLFGEVAQKYLMFVRQNPIQLLLSNGESEQALLVFGSDILKKVVEAVVPVLPTPMDLRAVGEGAVRVAAHMLAPSALSVPGYPVVTDVCVSVVQMPEVVAAQRLFNSIGEGKSH